MRPRCYEKHLAQEEETEWGNIVAELQGHYFPEAGREGAGVLCPEALADPSLPLEQQPPAAVSRAADIWAMGVIAFELLTQERVFPPEATDEDVGALRGRGLPWEVSVAGQVARCTKLRGLRGAVLACLEREAARQPSAGALLASWEHVFDSMKTRGTFDNTRTSHGGAAVASGSGPTSRV